MRVILNEGEQGDIVVVIRDDGDVLVRREDLTAMRLTQLPGDLAPPGDYVSLRALAPRLKYELDLVNLRLKIDADPALFPVQVIDLSLKPPKDIVYTNESTAYLNYGLNYSLDNENHYTSANVPLELALHGKDVLFFSGFSHTRTPNTSSSVRLLSYLRWDRPASQSTYILGDFEANSGTLGGGGVFGGFSLARNFRLTPYFAPSPALDLVGLARTRSKVDVYINGFRASTQDVEPGHFELRNLPQAIGVGTATVEITDAFGRVERIDVPFNVGSDLLREGVTEFGYSVGVRRNHLGSVSNAYSDFTGVGWHRWGVSNDFTVGYRTELSAALANGGLSAGLALGPFGQMGADVAWSRALADEQEPFVRVTGSAQQIGYSYQHDWFRFGAIGRRISDHYANLSLRPESDRTSQSKSVAAGMRLGQLGSLSASYLVQDWLVADDVKSAIVSYSIQFGRSISLVLFGRELRTIRDGEEISKDRQVGASISMQLGEGDYSHTVGASREVRNDIPYDRVFVTHVLPPGPGWGYHLTVDRDGSTERYPYTTSGDLRYNSTFGTYSASATHSGTTTTKQLAAAGSLARVRGGYYFGRPIRDAFAVVHIPDAPDVGIYASNNDMGKTNSNGDLLVPDLLSYYGNELSFDQHDLGMNRHIADARKRIAPPYRGGALVEFELPKFQAFVGTAYYVINGSRKTADLSTLQVRTGEQTLESVVGRGGAVYLENLTPGTHPARLFDDKHDCEFELVVPSGNELMVDLGALLCAVH